MGGYFRGVQWENAAQTAIAIQNVSEAPTVIPSLAEYGARLRNREKVDPQKYDVSRFLFV